MADRADLSPLVAPSLAIEPNKIDLEAGPGEEISAEFVSKLMARFIISCL
ncbi:hypothetical protein Hanom_Chr02g00118261 [Helianthus anomalus]